MRVTEDDQLSVAFAKLRRTAAPGAYDEFIAAFERYALKKQTECVQAPSNQVFLAQGRAQQCVVLSTLFTDALVAADKVTAQQK